MRKHLKVLAAATMTVSALGFATATRAEDPAHNQSADKATQVEREIAGRPASPAADDVREILAEATSAAVQGKFEDAQKRFSKEDRKRLGDQFNNSSTLRDHFSQFEKDWKARYDEDFNSAKIEKALVNSGVKIYEGELTDRARLASATVSPDAQSSAAGSTNAKPESGALNRDAATVAFVSGTDAAPTIVVLRKEDGIGNTWRIDVPDKASNQELENRLNKQVMAIEENKGTWPSDVNDAYRMVTRRVLTALIAPVTSSSGSNGDHAAPTTPNQ